MLSEVPWPMPGVLRTHAGSPYTGTPSDVLTCTIAPGYVWQKAGSGAPVTHSADGFTFDGGCYLEMTLPSPYTFNTISIHGAVTFENWSSSDPGYAAMNNSTGTILGITTASGDATLTAQRASRRLSSDLGPNYLTVREVNLLNIMHDLRHRSRAVVGVHATTNPAYMEYGAGKAALWGNGSILISDFDVNAVTADKIVMGKDFVGTMHDGIVAIENAAYPQVPLWADGTNCRAIHRTLMDMYPPTDPAQP